MFTTFKVFRLRLSQFQVMLLLVTFLTILTHRNDTFVGSSYYDVIKRLILKPNFNHKQLKNFDYIFVIFKFIIDYHLKLLLLLDIKLLFKLNFLVL